MIDSKVIIVGGGPAGSACAWKLRQYEIPAMILDSQSFPRPKTCAGWITPRVFEDLKIDASEYPGGILTFRRLNFYFWGRKIPVKTHQYSIRRFEFDHWLVDRTGFPLIPHAVKNIRQEYHHYIIDDQYRCEYLVGAGGTNCPVYRAFFRQCFPRNPLNKIVAMEEEFKSDDGHRECHLWFFDNRLPGYAWFVPKGNGFVNVGIGGKYARLRKQGVNLTQHWDRLVQKLADLSLVTKRDYRPKGCSYYLRDKERRVQLDKAYVIGDAAGLATRDMGEGIGPAVRSGILAAEAIASDKQYSLRSIRRYSAMDIWRPGRRLLF